MAFRALRQLNARICSGGISNEGGKHHRRARRAVSRGANVLATRPNLARRGGASIFFIRRASKMTRRRVGISRWLSHARMQLRGRYSRRACSCAGGILSESHGENHRRAVKPAETTLHLIYPPAPEHETILNETLPTYI